MKRFFLLVFAAIIAAGVWACPAMPGAFRHVKMVDGTTVKAFIHGDEFFNYETDENEFLLTPNDNGLYVNTRRRISAEEVQQRREEVNRLRRELKAASRPTHEMHERYNAALQKLKEMKKEYEWEQCVNREFIAVESDMKNWVNVT